MNTNTRPTKLAIAFAALVAIGTADGVTDSGSIVLDTPLSNYGGDNDGDHVQSQKSSYSGPYQGYSQYSNGGQKHRDGQYHYGYQNEVNNYNSNAFSQIGYQQVIPLVQKPVAYQNNGFNNQNWYQQQNNIINPPQTGNYIFTNNAQLINSNSPLNNGQSVLIQGINQYIPGQGLYPSVPNIVNGGNFDNDKERRHQRKGNDHDRQNGQNGQGGYAYGQNLMIIDPNQGIPNQNTIFPAHDHDTGVVSPRSPLIFNGFPTNFNQQQQQHYINSLPKAQINLALNGPDLNDVRTYGQPYQHGIAAPVENDSYQKYKASLAATWSSVPPVYPLIPGTPISSIPPGSLVGIPLNPNNQNNYGQYEGHHDNYNQGQWNGGNVEGHGDRDRDGDYKGQGYNGPQNLRTSGLGVNCC